ncbi:hypothetical protein [Sphingomonas immobilis]|uniref:ATP-binding protein n=1 Tax=Sphingomonas immobilis TaxID=3063997 RepID=A0ABT9A143_9SPHN|nr:hypothetical protein [Sphingomonas sp. CA1-15]MDO7843554.1 hypothetical protein [Sphingomonas sp. CA1-15]
MTTGMIADLLGNAGMFYRSVALERDAADPGASRSLVLTPWLERGAAEILAGLRDKGTRRAWRIIGDFGVGKSALALALVQALDPRVSDPAMPMRRLVEIGGGAPRMFPLIVTGSRVGLTEGVRAALAHVAVTPGLLAPKTAKAILACAEPFDAIIALRDALRASGAFDGLLLVIDEMGKFLEAASDAHGFDVFRLQALAEAAARSGDAPLGVVLILHKGFQSYAEDWRAARRGEWEKVAERFEELVFDHPLSHTAALLSAALAIAPIASGSKVRKAHDDAIKRVRALGWLGPRTGPTPVGCWPVHPAALPVMARFFARHGQNERSLFGFAASEEPNGLRAFAATTPVGTDLYGVQHFFDYVASSFGHRLTSRASSGEWDRIAAVLDRASEADAVETAVLKTIGMLNLVDALDLSATTDSVRAALVPAFTPEAIDDAVARLVTGGLLFRRPGRTELRLWTSRRVDLTAIWADAAREVDAQHVLRDLPRHLSGLPIRSHVLARRHSVTKGTSRRFAVRCTHASALTGFEDHGEADGGVVAVICGNDEDQRIARAWAAEVTGEQSTMLVVPVPAMPELGPMMLDLLRHRWVVANAGALQEDAFAAAEIDRGIADLEIRLVAAVEAAVGLSAHAPSRPVLLFRSGGEQALTVPIHVTISTLCDTVFNRAPLVENELVNRHALTSAGAGARQRLIESMFAHAHDPELGFAPKKNPPERALYLSLLRRGRIHREIDGTWTIAPPRSEDDPLRLRPALDAIEARLSAADGRVPLGDLYALVRAKPYGVRRGLAPLLLATTLVAAGHRVALFERGTYCTRLDGAAFMRILKGPEHFALQWVSLEGVRADVFRRLAVLLDQPPVASGIRVVVDPLIRFGVDLPFHVQHSPVLGDTARAVLKVLKDTRSPIDLVFSELPAACGAEPFGADTRADAARAGAFVETLDAAVAELRACYPKLLERMRSELLFALDARDRADLIERAAPLGFRVREAALKTFILRVADGALGEDPWTEALAGAVVGKPPSRWLAHDVDLWRSRLAELAGQFNRVEAAAFGNGESARSAVRVSLTKVDGHERSVIVDVDDLTSAQLTVFHSLSRMAKEADISLDKVAALLSLEVMHEQAGQGADAPVERQDRA